MIVLNLRFLCSLFILRLVYHGVKTIMDNKKIQKGRLLMLQKLARVFFFFVEQFLLMLKSLVLVIISHSFKERVSEN